MDSPTHTIRGAAPEPHVAGGDDRKTARRGAVFICIVLVGYIVYLVVTGQIAQFWEAMQSVQAPWLVAACVCMLLYLIFGILAYAIAVWLDPKSPVGIRDLISVEASGIFFGNLTPMMMGSTPAQIYRLTKAGQNVGEAGAIQFTRFIVYQFGLVVWGAVLLLARMPFFASQYGDITLLCIFSFGGHVLILLAIFAIALMPNTVTKVAHWGINLLARLGVARERTEGWHAFVDGEIHAFSEKFRLAAGHLSSMALTVVITLLQLAFFYLVPYFLMLAFGHHEVDFFSVMAASAFVQLLSSAVPLPGGTGGAEGGFALFLGHFYGSAATAGYLLWRLITFIAPTILAAPLLGLHSSHSASIHDRWDRAIARLGRSKRGRTRSPRAGAAAVSQADAHRVAAGLAGGARGVVVSTGASAAAAGSADCVHGTTSGATGATGSAAKVAGAVSATASASASASPAGAAVGVSGEQAGTGRPDAPRSAAGQPATSSSAATIPSGATTGHRSASRAASPASVRQAQHVRRTAGGITVSPGAFKRKR